MFLTIDWCLPRKDHYHQLEALVSILKMLEHGLHTVGSLGILAETRLALDGHPCIPRDLPQLVCEGSLGKDRFRNHYRNVLHAEMS